MPDLFSISWWRNAYLKMGRGAGFGCLAVFSLSLFIGFGANQFGNPRNVQGAADRNAVIATVNSQPITRDEFLRNVPNQGGSGETLARTQGGVMMKVVQFALLREFAKKYDVRVSDADVDRRIAQEREQRLGKNATDAQWEDYIRSSRGEMTAAMYREALAQDPELLIAGLRDKLKSLELVTPEDIKQYNQQVQLRVVKVGYGAQPFADPKTKSNALTEDQARTKVTGLLARAKGGGDVAAIAKANSDDFTKVKGGDTGFLLEYRKSPSPVGGEPEDQLTGSYGKDFAEAVHKTATGQFTDVVKISSFGSNAYGFAKVEARREAPPTKPDPANPTAQQNTTDPKKITDEIKQLRASEKFGKEFKAAFDNAKVVFKPEGADVQVYYDYARLQQMQQEADQAKMMAQFGRPSTDKIATPAELDALRKTVDAELEAQYAKHKEDSTLALLVAKSTKSRMELASSDEKAKLRDRLIDLYNTALKSVEDRNIRFELAELYRNKGDMASAEAAYQKISHLLDLVPGFDSATLRQEQAARRRLSNGFKTVNKPDEAAKEDEKLASLDAKIAEATRREAASAPSGQSPTFSVPPGGSAGGTMPAGPGAR